MLQEPGLWLFAFNSMELNVGKRCSNVPILWQISPVVCKLINVFIMLALECGLSL